MNWGARIYCLRGWLAAFLGIWVFLLGEGKGSIGWWGLLGAGIALRIWARRYIGEHTRASHVEAPRLSTGGPYSFIAHPLYLSNLLIFIGYSLWWTHASTWGILCSALAIAFYWGLAQQEDFYLYRRFPEEWTAWRKQVPYAFWPCRTPSSTPPPLRTWIASLWADRWSWLWLIAASVFLLLWSHHAA